VAHQKISARSMGEMNFALDVNVTNQYFFSVKVLYFSVNSSSVIIFFLLAKKWKFIMNRWYEKEMVFLNKPYTAEKYNLKWKINATALVILLAGISKLTIFLLCIYEVILNIILSGSFRFGPILMFLGLNHIKINF
jgi:hypothetical protein